MWERGRIQPLVGHLAGIITFLGYDPYPPPECLAGRLLGVRRRLGLTQAQLAGRLGQDEHQICRWERGRRRPHPWITGRLDLALLEMEGRATQPKPAQSFFDLTRWRRRLPEGMSIAPVTHGERFRASRLRAGLSMSELARKTGVSRGTIYRMERGMQKPSKMLRRKLEKTLKLDPIVSSP